MITITTTKIIIHPETSAAALSTIQCLTGSDTLLHNCMPTQPAYNHILSVRARERSDSQGRLETQGRLICLLVELVNGLA